MHLFGMISIVMHVNVIDHSTPSIRRRLKIIASIKPLFVHLVKKRTQFFFSLTGTVALLKWLNNLCNSTLRLRKPTFVSICIL
ncbi:hypothetical protein BDA96_04G057500 [Sorghum bicolor]|jgi:hypothetical protein|uniref:Uncharacterized protein n=2 Tax=Sorghum bicolor TaxID=4558 RepID=A0A1Z5RLH2_SORBI|nr:hypothetical protein BDA96_04G057500 [Sorghum bicolor]OQU84429.1 hypothetical protein SORBI_3004G052401 [Sorghum bicolor]OQU84430.1 hypothetical protein SORBI_3004G052401 [Sorghum bicolor]